MWLPCDKVLGGAWRVEGGEFNVKGLKFWGWVYGSQGKCVSAQVRMLGFGFSV